jgi:CBS domain-containing membrane protein
LDFLTQVKEKVLSVRYNVMRLVHQFLFITIQNASVRQVHCRKFRQMNTSPSALKVFERMRSNPQSKAICKWQIMWSWLGAFLGIGLVSILSGFLLDGTGLTLTIGSFGASAVLIYGAVDSPLAQPRNLIGGHILSAIVGVTCFQFFPDQLWLASPAAVATAIAVMQLTGTVHPPGGATALIAVIGGPGIHDLGYFYVILPVATGAVLMLIVAMVVNNVAPGRCYPSSRESPPTVTG